MPLRYPYALSYVRTQHVLLTGRVYACVDVFIACAVGIWAHSWGVSHAASISTPRGTIRSAHAWPAARPAARLSFRSAAANVAMRARVGMMCTLHMLVRSLTPPSISAVRDLPSRSYISSRPQSDPDLGPVILNCAYDWVRAFAAYSSI